MKNIFILIYLLLFCIHARAKNIDTYYYNYFDGMPLSNTSHSYQYLDYEIIIDAFSDYMASNPFAKTDAFIEFMQNQLSGYCYGDDLYNKCFRKYYKHFLNILRNENKIDNLFYLIVDDRIRNYKSNLIDLSSYLKSLKSLFRKRVASYSDPHPFFDLSFLYTRSLNQRFGVYNGITPRQMLYLKYGPYQIKQLGYQLKKMINIMQSENAYIFIDMADNDMLDLTINLSYTEKYRLGLKLLKIHLEKLTLDPNFGFKPLYIDVLLAGVETGVLHPDYIKQLYLLPEFQDPYRNRFKVYKEVLVKFAKQILLQIPYVGQLSLIPILIFETRQELRQSRRNAANDTHLF